VVTARMLLVLLALAAGGCGRLGYDPVAADVASDAGAGAAASDAGADAWNPPLPPRRPRGFVGGSLPGAPRPPRFP
jgi:hypothetical protein